MPTNPNMVAIQTVTVGAGGAASIEFTSIPATYTDLVLKTANRSTRSATTDTLFLKFNNTTTSYSQRRLYAFGTTVGSDSLSSTGLIIGGTTAANATANTFSNIEIYIPNYAGSTNKSVSSDGVSEDNSSSGNFLLLNAGLWSNTSAINQITLNCDVGNFAQYSTATLYGVTSAGYGAKATGGAIYQDADYFYHAFFSSGTFTPTQSLTADCLVIAGGGAGAGAGGGGGAGGLLAYTSQSLTATNYTITVGAGGASVLEGKGNNGTNSQFASLTASVGGGGGGSDYTNTVAGETGANGGSGGGQAMNPLAGSTAGTGTAGQGNNGGSGSNAGGGYGGGGGGGATAVGANGSASGGGNGGAGSSTYSSWGLATSTGQNVSGTVWYAGGGGGGATAGATTVGGNGGGGGGLVGANTTGVAGLTNSGSGGGASGGGGGGGRGGNGGSGIVIVRYAK